MDKFKILFFLSIVSCFLHACKEKEAEKPPQPNVVIILSDDQAWGDLSINGNKNIETPHIDGIANAGAIFNNFYVAAVCSPTRAELLTGRYSFRSGVYGTGGGAERMDIDETTIAEVFKKAGYETAAYGKWHNGMQYPYHPNARGFDDFYGFCSGHWGNYFSPMLEHNGEIVDGKGFIIDDFTNHGLEFIENNKNKPFLLYLPYNTPHTPLQAPEENWTHFKNKEITMLANTDDENLTETRAALAMCENIDDNVGRVINKLKQLNLEANTIVLFFSDNGPAKARWNGNMKKRKGSTEEGGVRSPLVMKWPKKIKAGTKIERLVSAIDLLPTLSELCGIDYKTNKPLDGISFKNTLLGNSVKFKDRFLLNAWKDQISIRTQKYRLSYDDKLYDIENDRAQQNDISLDVPEIKNRLKNKALAFKKTINEELPEIDERPFFVGHPDMKFTQIPARDGNAHGNIKRSNRWPNCSFFTNWVSLKDSITWQVKVPETGRFKVKLFYTCPKGDEGSLLQLSFLENKLTFNIKESHDPPLIGMEKDLVPRIESYVKDWKQVDIGNITLQEGTGELALKALEMAGKSIMDFRLLLFERIP
ncbi:arylsulfatase A-like enzyme [Jejuia pallidilutea]|uniref:Arylsulfatase A-like enzyme n=1 Tax=Jejuia pallidilutea TaxID=504487 RepID=A0A362XBA4_9FLAO|nr:arylsulfatase [Jejuia pallidilutea]PQV51501.1 arylsulfatase A-like enzyme [Jejuia pallidilutea]